MNSDRFLSATTNDARYLLDNAAPEAHIRLSALAELFDSGTTRHLESCGVSGGWRCLEIGAGNGSIARWLADRVGPTGQVIATDIDTRHLYALNDARIEVWRHDLAIDSLPLSTFDLVHARLVLVHIPGRDEVLKRIIRALKPGGWLLLEEFDSFSMPPDPGINPGETFLRTHQALARLMTDRQFERRYGRLLYGKLRSHGLVSVGAEARIFMCQGGSPGTSLLRANLEQLRGLLIGGGYISQKQFEEDVDTLNQPDFLMPSSLLWSVSARRPAA